MRGEMISKRNKIEKLKNIYNIGRRIEMVEKKKLQKNKVNWRGINMSMKFILLSWLSECCYMYLRSFRRSCIFRASG